MKKQLPDPEPRYVGLLALPYQALRWELIKTAIELKVFDQLNEPVDAEGVAAALSTHPANTKYLLNGLTAMGLVSKRNGLFSNTDLAGTYLTGNGDLNIGTSLLFMGSWVDPLLNGGTKELVTNGPPPPKDLSKEEIWEHAARSALAMTRCGRAQRLAGYISEIPEFSSFGRMLDMGSGAGIISVAVAALHPDLDCVLLDQPAVCRVADEVIAEYGLENRVKTRPGNYFSDDIGNNYDFIMANYTLNFYRDKMDRIMDKTLKALNSGGIFMVTSDGLTNERTAPETTVISWLSSCMTGSDMGFERGAISAAMLKAGFVSTESRTLTDIEMEAHGPMEMVIGRKSARH